MCRTAWSRCADGVPYEGIENLRPETQALVDAFLAGKSKK
jgi:hypothetical protein